jgi:hypothetical protein
MGRVLTELYYSPCMLKMKYKIDLDVKRQNIFSVILNLNTMANRPRNKMPDVSKFP